MKTFFHGFQAFFAYVLEYRNASNLVSRSKSTYFLPKKSGISHFLIPSPGISDFFSYPFLSTIWKTTSNSTYWQGLRYFGILEHLLKNRIGPKPRQFIQLNNINPTKRPFVKDWLKSSNRVFTNLMSYTNLARKIKLFEIWVKLELIALW